MSKLREAAQAALEMFEHMEGRPHVRGKDDCYEDIIEEIRAALAEPEDTKLRADAERYRWLRDGEDVDASLFVLEASTEEWDALIDAAMEDEHD